jgi:2-dehydro-3-deoxyphosphooctonate aldolase (KDO 8-P synthase)
MDKYPGEIEFFFKASFDKANRTSLDSYRGVGLEEGIRILSLVQDMGIKTLTDIHEPSQVIVAIGMDALQIPAFLCRQTDLVQAIAEARTIVNIKKGQFLAPEDVRHIIKKIEATGNQNIMITERGTCFGYNNLIVDYRSFKYMSAFGYPVIFDVTHAQQKPSIGKETGGSTEYVLSMAKGAIATGYVDGLFFECHPTPEYALSDKATSLNYEQVEELVKESVELWRFIHV